MSPHPQHHRRPQIRHVPQRHHALQLWLLPASPCQCSTLTSLQFLSRDLVAVPPVPAGPRTPFPLYHPLHSLCKAPKSALELARTPPSRPNTNPKQTQKQTENRQEPPSQTRLKSRLNSRLKNEPNPEMKSTSSKKTDQNTPAEQRNRKPARQQKPESKTGK